MTVGNGPAGGSETEESTPVGRLTEELEETGGKMGRLAAGSVGFKKTVEMTVTVTGLPAAGSVACGLPFEVEREGTPPPPVKLSSTGGMEEG